MRFFYSFILLVLSINHSSSTNKKPNIIMIIADDLGSNDVSFHGSNEIPTPNIDALAYNGVILNNHYTQALCTPSRASLLTGKYPIHLGMQHLVILEPEPWGMPINETILPQHLKRNGYKTHAIGKWHLGFFKKEYTPTYRGFDSHFGYWQGLQDYYEHTVRATYTKEYGYDMRRNMSVDWESKGKYSTTLYTEEAVKLIKEHDTTNPMFMYFAHLAPHTGNDENPLQAPDEEIAKFSYIEDPERRVYAAMVSLLDQSVGKVVTALKEKHMLENTIIVFMSDNGAKTSGIHANHGSNHPLRGLKNSAWEGAVRNIAAIWSPLIKKPQRVSNELMHISDWLPTLLKASGLNTSELGSIDGKDVWESISENTKSPRTDLVYNIDDVWNYGAIRQGDWKYIYGTTFGGREDQWYGSSPNDTTNIYAEEQVLKSPVGVTLNSFVTFQQIREQKNKKPHEQSKHFTSNILTAEKIRKLRSDAKINCNKIKSDDLNNICKPQVSPCLFNIKEDPCETRNLASILPSIFSNMEKTLLEIRKTMIQPINIPRDPIANPINWNGTWTNWKDYTDVYSKKLPVQQLSPLAIGLITASCFAFIVISIILCIISCKQKRKNKLSNIFRSLEDPMDKANYQLNGKDKEMSTLNFKDGTKINN